MRLRGQGGTPLAAGRRLTLPEGEEDDRLDHEELEDGAVGAEQFASGKVEEEEGVEGQADRDVVDDGHVEVAAGDAARTEQRSGLDRPFPGTRSLPRPCPAPVPTPMAVGSAPQAVLQSHTER